MKLRYLFLVLLFNVKLLCGFFSDKNIGTTTGTFLKISPSSEGVSLAGAYSSQGKPVEGLYLSLIHISEPTRPY